MKSFLQQAFLAILSLISPALCASQRPAPDTYEIQGEYLYFQPLFDQGTYAVGTSSTSGTLLADRRAFVNEFDWESAYRLALLYGFCNCENDVEIRWTHLHANGHDSASDPVVTGGAGQLTAVGYPTVTQAFAFVSSSDLTLTYYAIEGLVGQLLFSTCDLEIFGQTGIHYANFDFHEDIYYQNATTQNTIINKSQSWWVGPEFVINFNYDLFKTWCCEFPLAFCGNIRTAFLVGKTKNRFFGANNTPLTYANTEEEVWRIVPYFDIRFGLNYTWCWTKLKINFEAGYEILDYIEALQSMRFYDANQSGANFNLTSSLGFHGPYLALNLGF